MSNEDKQPDERAAFEALHGDFDAAYRAFKGAFDTPQMRRQINNEYAEDARKRLREFAEAFAARATAPQATMPPLTDAMRAVLRNEDCIYGTEDELYEALVEAAKATTPQADAERYRWLRANGTDYTHWQFLKRLETDVEFDAYVDAAREAGK